ncbi:MAG: PKD domain-containing protein [Sphingobacteriales bacterium]|nr:PKD domain-containing protein [Sphingobacteriales bacterium]
MARFTHTACLNSLSATFNNTSSGAASYTWNFGDPASGSNNISTATNPSHTFSGYGTYVVLPHSARLGYLPLSRLPNRADSCPQLHYCLPRYLPYLPSSPYGRAQ